ncbi:hypothetical protein N9Y42_03970 [Mariniblastus sp.]|nr:hypothetical protein [Mariniblastus sp.]
MKKVILSFSVVALMLIGSVLNAQEVATATFAQPLNAGCSSCGQQSFVQPVSYSQPVAAPATFAQPLNAGCSSCGQQSFVQPVSYSQPAVAPATFAQPLNAGCSSCGQQSFVQPVSYSQPAVATPTFTQPATTGCSACGTASVANYTAPINTSYVPQTSGCSTCATQSTGTCCSSRGGFLRGGRNGGRGGLFGTSASSRLLRTGAISAIRN